MKFKWALPFMPLVNLADPPPPDLTIRVIRAVALLLVTGILLVIVRPWWQRDDLS